MGIVWVQKSTNMKLLIKKNGINNIFTMKRVLLFISIFFITNISFSQTYGGLGAVINIDSISKLPFIVEVKMNTPAEKLNLKPKDFITNINGYSTLNYTIKQTISEIRGAVGTTCNLTILRDKKEFLVTFTRAELSEDKDELSFSSKKVHIICELPEERKINFDSENYKQSLFYLEEAKEKRARSKHFMKLAIETCNDNKIAHLTYADSLKSWQDASMRYSAQVYGPPIPKQQIYQPKNWQHFASSHEDAYGHVLEQYESVLAIDPRHLRSRLNVADIYYFNGQFDSCAKHLNRFFCAIPREQHGTEACSQARRMIRRCEWLKSLPENSIKLNTLYWDKGRAETLLFALGAIGMTAGEIYSYRSGKLDGALVGAGFNLATMALQKSRDNLKWFGILQEKEDYAALYEKCQKQLPMRINTTGFYSYETMMVLAGIVYAGKKLDKKCGELKYNANALIDIIQIANPQVKPEYDDFKFIVRQGIEAGLTIANCDKSLLIYEEVELYDFLIEFNRRLTDAGDKSYLPTKTLDVCIKRRDLLKNLIDSISSPDYEKNKKIILRRNKIEESIKNGLVILDKNANDIDARIELATAYEEKGDYKKAIDQYEYLLNHYKKKKDTEKAQEIQMRLKACKLIMEKESK